MKTLLRSTIACRPSDDIELFLRNYQLLRDSNLGFEKVEDNVIWQYVQDFVQQHHHIPDHTTVTQHFKVLGEIEVVDRFNTIITLAPKVQGNFKDTLKVKSDERKVRQATETLKEAGRIISQGLTIKGERGQPDRILRGPEDAIKYVMDMGHDIVTPLTGVRLSGDVTSDGENVGQEYERVENDPLAGIGQFCGIAQIDNAIKGAKRQELWTHAAFTGGLKSTFAINWLYNQAVYYQHSGLMFSLEMPYQQVRRIFYALHSHHEKFASIRKALGIGKSLDYGRIRDGELDHHTDEEIEAMSEEDRAKLIDGRINPDRPERKFFFEHVIPDFNDPTNNYGSIHIEVTDPNKSDFTVADLRSKAELLYSKDPTIACIIVDHAGLMSPRHRHRSTTENLNEVLRDLKRMAMNFNRGMGMAVVALFQISREGFKAAEKNGGRYNLTHLSYANEAERSSDIVTASFVDDQLRKDNLVMFQCLKSRDQAPFDPLYSRVYWPCRRIMTTHDVTPEDANKAGKRIDTEAAANLLDGA